MATAKRGMITASQRNSTTTSITRDQCDGEIAQKRVGTSSYTGVKCNYYDGGETRHTSVSNKTSYYYTRDHLGSVREVTNSSKTVVAAYDYTPYGERTWALTGSDTFNCEMAYTGHFYHPQSGTHLAWFRGYDPRIGRWLNADPIEEAGGLNLYGYVSNGPALFSDSLGLYKINADGSVDRELGAFAVELAKAAGQGLAAWVDGGLNVVPLIELKPFALLGVYNPCKKQFKVGNVLGGINREAAMILLPAGMYHSLNQVGAVFSKRGAILAGELGPSTMELARGINAGATFSSEVSLGQAVSGSVTYVGTKLLPRAALLEDAFGLPFQPDGKCD
ncbi:MAG: RHS repeat-associated core domain-containing protein [Verrucomicrobiae bacterium]|nr:RHS repeat-associated core domain-containing protein [Verrucomicrobiae bacterium]